ncbi:site-2 protease family protein [Nonomuraea glycinis]|uniref:Zinc metalloprotease n=1 Tax=Nonomuraea glycinis TaxID=2047744 RepID=A0A918E7E2_9ACTN|nr:site-2 protease family protein [Nonomuraea glycinis]MCA2177420.1 site-2 protease family protein [Nonomuraea glycinis]WSG66450.1 site-2 protease family protein [Nonomuraea glycinis]GGP09264.1 zinc metalloprotease [Nonomuraea glycinis]
MRSSISLGRIGGVSVGLNISVLFIVVILVFGLAFGRFPAVYPGLSSVAYVLAGLASAALFLASLLAHELAHALTAKRHGIEVAQITLWLLGGVAELRGEPRSPGADLKIAVVGPLTSLAAGAVFGGLALLSAAVGPPLVAGMFGYLSGVNVLLAVFNLIPAAPLDGGRVLRAALWARWGDRTRAAIASARAGRVFGYVLIALGFLQVVSGRGFEGLWLALIGLFLVNAASAEEQQSRIGTALYGVRVADAMTERPIVADPDETVAGLIDRVVMRERLSTYPLVDAGGGFAGLVTLNRIREVAPDRRASLRLRDIACPPEQVPRASPEEALTELLTRMSGSADGRAVVLDAGGHLVGLLTPTDISRVIQTADLHRGDLSRRAHGADLTGPYHDDHDRAV